MRNRFASISAGFATAALAASSLLAQAPAPTPDENPTGNTGALKEQIQTAGSYDAHSGNATRIAHDLHLPGALGVYGLDFTRYWNSLHPEYDNEFAVWPIEFGNSGWSHSWRWTAAKGIRDWQLAEGGGPQGTQYWETSITIGFPDGHSTKNKILRSNQSYQGQSPDCAGRTGGQPPYLEQCGERNWPPPGWEHDRLCDMAQDGSEFWLHLADGGSVHFTGGNDSWKATEVFDPHGLRTELQYGIDGHLMKVLQDGGRWLDITWDYRANFPIPVIVQVQSGGYAGVQTVTYNYNRYPDDNGNFLVLTSVDYPDDRGPGQSSHAIYTYGSTYTGDGPNAGVQAPYPLLKIANDPRYPGAMTTIRYDYYGGRCLPPEHTPDPPPSGYFERFYPQPFAIAAEKSGDTALPVSSFFSFCASATRQETNGFGATRNFFFGHSAVQGEFGCTGYELTKVTDFYTGTPNNVPFEVQNFSDGQPRQVWDGRNIVTELVVTPYHATGETGDDSGQPSEVHHTGSDGSVHYYDRINPGSSEARDPARIHNPFNHWLFSYTDEHPFTTTYVRDSRMRVKDIIYPVTAEHFTYKVYGNGETYNQVETHTLPSGAVQTYEYDDTTHRLIREYNSVDGWDARKEYIYDDPSHPDLVHKVIDGRARLNGAAYSTRMEYNGRNRIIEVHYAATGANPDPMVSYGYDAYGNCTSMTDELGHTSIYAYDSYRRCISYTEQLDAQTSRTWNWYYDRYFDGVGLIDASTHTSKQWRVQVEPAYNAAGDRPLSAHKFDYNNRVIEEASGLFEAADGTWHAGPDTEVHNFSYDENGQKKSYTDPRGRLTTYDYDLRNRLWKTNETVNSVPRTTETLYDVTGNKTLVTFPDTRTQQWLDYDAFGQAWTFIDERNNTTNLTYVWGPMKKLYTVTTHRAKDGGGTEDQQTTYSYDLMGKPTDVEFPDHTHETTTYEFDQLKTWKTRKNQTKAIVYDARGRELSHAWDDQSGGCNPGTDTAATPCVARSWDDANRLASISNKWSSIDFAYNDAGEVIWEGDEIAGSGGRTQTNYYRYPEGSIAHLHYPGGAYVRHDYTARGQLAATGWDDDGNNWWMKLAAYTYLPDGKVGQLNYGNGMRCAYGYDERGFTQIVDHYNVPLNLDYSWRQYWRDSRDRITAFQKGSNSYNPWVEDGRGDHYVYDNEGQVTDAWYSALDPHGNFNSWYRKDHFDYDALGNRQGSNNNVASRSWGTTAISFDRRDNGLNQYSGWTPSIIYYDDNFQYPTPPWLPPGNGVMMADGYVVGRFNALNQPVVIGSAATWATGSWMWFGYDPLGRCVKRWVGPLDENGNDPPAWTNPATYFHYDGWNMLQEGANAWGPERVYVHGNRMDEIVWSYNTFTGEQGFHHYDAGGNCTLLTDSLGGILEQYLYDAFGHPYFLDRWGLENGFEYSFFGNRFLFAGREYLTDLQLYDFRNRMYQPELGRFLQPDPKEFGAGDYNLYRYCHNDPVNKSDPFGLLEADHEDKELAKPILVEDRYRPVTGSYIPIHIRVFNSGNWNDRKVANHATTGLEAQTGKGGLTKPIGSSNVSGSNVDINMHVDWYYDAKYSGTNVVTRELQHVQDARSLSRGYGNGSRSASLGDFRQFGNIVKGFNIMEKLNYDQSGGPHDLNTHPAMPTNVPEFDDTH
jgi:RHS repeat-associated protein